MLSLHTSLRKQEQESASERPEVTHAPCRASSLSMFRSDGVTIVSRIPSVIRHAFLTAKCVNDNESNSHGVSEGNNLQHCELYFSPIIKTRRINSSFKKKKNYSGIWNTGTFLMTSIISSWKHYFYFEQTRSQSAKILSAYSVIYFNITSSYI